MTYGPSLRGFTFAPVIPLHELRTHSFPPFPGAATTLNSNDWVSSILGKCRHHRHLKQFQAFLTGHSQTHFFTFKLLRFFILALADLHCPRSIFDSSCSPNVYLYTVYASDLGQFPSALRLLRHMIRSGSPMANHFIYPHVLKASDGVFMTWLVHAQVMKCGFWRYPVVETALVDSFARMGAGGGIAQEMFSDMCERTVISWTDMVFGFARIVRTDEAMGLFEEMTEREVPSWNALIAGCTQNGLFPEAVDLSRRMASLSEGVHGDVNRPNQVSVVCSLSACDHTGMTRNSTKIHY